MAAQTGLSKAGQAGLLALGAAVLVGILWFVQRPAPAPEAAPAALLSPTPEGSTGTSETTSAPAVEPAPAGEPATTPEAAAVPATDPAVQPAPETAFEPPRFDTVRVTPEGEALVAGRAAPGAEVTVLVDGVAAAQALADGAGSFAALFTLPQSAAPRLITLSMVADGAAVASTQSVALEPVAPQTGVEPPVVAAADPAAQPEVTPPEAPAPAATATATAEPQAPTAILLSDHGATVLQGAAPAAGADVSIAAITYTPDGAVQLSGLGAPGAVVRLYLDTAEAGQALVSGTGGWVTTLRGVAPGLYTLRADQLDAAGKVTARFETPFQRETLEALASVMKPAAASGTPVPKSVAVPQAQPTAPDVAAAPAAQPAVAPEAPLTVTVQPGFTLWRIARENFGDGVMYVKVFEANKDQIRNPDLIYPGQVFTVPATAE